MERNGFVIHFPKDENGLDQDEEFCIVENGSCRKKVRFHNYDELYKVEGLYEHLFYDVLKCNSPKTVCGKLLEVVETSDIEPSGLKVLDLGAGNGMVGEELKNIGVEKVIGIDIIPGAMEAQLRDRPEVYDGYFVQDLTRLGTEVRGELQQHDFNCMTTVAALGFGDIPPLAFSEGFNMINKNGIVAFNIRDKFVDNGVASGFSELIGAITEDNILDVQVREKYRHRLGIDGKPIYYYVIAGIKNEDIPVKIIEQYS